MEIWPGTAYPLGASFDGAGTNCGVLGGGVARRALPDRRSRRRVARPAARDGRVRLARVCPAGAAGSTLRVPRPRTVRAPERGQRCNPAKLLLDPYAKAIQGQVSWHPSVFSYDFGDRSRHNDEDSGPCDEVRRRQPVFDWQNDRHPRTQYHDTVIYEGTSRA